jgi:hypothetical protein
MSVVNIARDRDCVAHAHPVLVDSPEPLDQVAALLTKKAQFTASRAMCQASAQVWFQRWREGQPEAWLRITEPFSQVQ